MQYQVIYGSNNGMKEQPLGIVLDMLGLLLGTVFWGSLAMAIPLVIKSLSYSWLAAITFGCMFCFLTYRMEKIKRAKAASSF